MRSTRVALEIECSSMIILNLFGARMISRAFVLLVFDEVLAKSNAGQVRKRRGENSIVVGLSADFVERMGMSGPRFS